MWLKSHFMKNDSAALFGKIIGTPGCYQHDGTHEYTNVFDGKTWTSFDYFKFTGGWAGLDLGRKVQIDRIVYTPATGIIIFVLVISTSCIIVTDTGNPPEESRLQLIH